MDIQIKNATLEEITIIADRLANPSFREMEAGAIEYEKSFLAQDSQQKSENTKEVEKVEPKEIKKQYTLDEIKALSTQYNDKFGIQKFVKLLDSEFHVKSVPELKEEDYFSFAQRLKQELPNG